MFFTLKISGESEVDGRTLQSLKDYEALSPPFDFTAVAKNPFGVCELVNQCPLHNHAVADGFWIILAPLSAGRTHTIHFKADVPFPDVIPPGMPFTFTTEVTYNLRVQGGQ